MATLQETCELAWRQCFPNPSDETSITKEEFIATGRREFAYQSLLFAWKEKSDEGYFDVPSYLSTEVELPVVNDEIDISSLKILRSLPQEIWVQNIGGLGCHCKYIKSTVNMTALLCEDDSRDDAAKTYYFLGKKIRFPQGVHKTPLTIIYANSGDGVDGTTEIDDAIAGIIRTRLLDIYLGKTPPEDTTNNSNANPPL